MTQLPPPGYGEQPYPDPLNQYQQQYQQEQYYGPGWLQSAEHRAAERGPVEQGPVSQGPSDQGPAEPRAPQHRSTEPRSAQPNPVQDHSAQPHPLRPEFRVAAIRQHARRVIAPSLVCIAAAAVIGFSFRGLREPGDWVSWAVLAGVVGILFGIVPIVAWLRHRYQITTVRTISSRGLIRSVKREIAHHQVVKVEMKRNPWQALFGSGTISLTAVNGRVFELKDVPNSVTVAQALRELTGNVNRHDDD